MNRIARACLILGIILTNAVTAKATYYDWSMNYGLFGIMADPGMDPDSDGSSNFKEYVLGSDPTIPDFISPEMWVKDNNYFGYVYFYRQPYADDLNYSVLFALDSSHVGVDPLPEGFFYQRGSTTVMEKFFNEDSLFRVEVTCPSLGASYTSPLHAISGGISFSGWADIYGVDAVLDGDSDGDGFIDGDEFCWGGNPLVRDLIRPPVYPELIITNNMAIYSFPSVDGVKYEVETRSSLMVGSWGESRTNLFGSGDTLSFAVPSDGASMFFRVLVTDNPTLLASAYVLGYQKIYVESHSEMAITYPFVSSSRTVGASLLGGSFGDSIEIGQVLITCQSNGWSNPSLKLPDLGDGFVYRTANQEAFLFMIGEAPYSEVITKECLGGEEYIAYPFPVDTTLAELISEPNEQDRVGIWNGFEYMPYEYSSGLPPYQPAGWSDGFDIFDGSELYIYAAESILYLPHLSTSLSWMRPYEEESFRGLHGWLNDSGNLNERAYSSSPDGDGIPSLLKYACGLESGTYVSNLFNSTVYSNELSITYTKAKGISDASVFAEWTSCLTNSNWLTDGLTLQKTEETSTNETWEARLPCTTSGFMRLKAEIIR